MPKKKTPQTLNATLQLPVPEGLTKGESAFFQFKAAGNWAAVHLAEKSGALLLSRRVWILGTGPEISLPCTQDLELDVLDTTVVEDQDKTKLLLNGKKVAGRLQLQAGKTYRLQAVGGPAVLLGHTIGDDGVRSGGEKPRLN